MADFKLKIRAFAFLDLLGFKNLVSDRKKRFRNASAEMPEAVPHINMLSEQMHPVRQYLKIARVKEEIPGVKTFILEPDTGRGTGRPAFFRAGQYLSLKVDVNGVMVTRPYSIASSPAESLKGFYAITVKHQERGFVTDHIWNTWKEGTAVEASGPEGQFYHEPLRDLGTIAGIAGGSGITPFMSMAKQFEAQGFPVNFVLFYGCNREQDIIFFDELSAIAKNSAGKFRIVPVLCEEKPFEGAEEGYVTAELMKKYINPAECSFFICGPQPMYEFVKKELETLALQEKQVRREVFGEIKNINAHEGYPGNVKESYELTVAMNGDVRKVPALSSESLLVALERAGMKPPSKCRSGVCAFCRSRLVRGDVFIPEDTDGRRAADKRFGYIHPCVSYPLGDVEIAVPGDQV